jgi:hypothetical protein
MSAPVLLVTRPPLAVVRSFGSTRLTRTGKFVWGAPETRAPWIVSGLR